MCGGSESEQCCLFVLKHNSNNNYNKSNFKKQTVMLLKTFF